MLLELVRHALPLIGVRRRRALARYVGPFRRIFTVNFQPLFHAALGIRQDGIGRAFRLANPAVDAFVGVDHQHILAGVETVHRADLHAVHILALDAGLGDDISHWATPKLHRLPREPGDWTGRRAS